MFPRFLLVGLTLISISACHQGHRVAAGNQEALTTIKPVILERSVSNFSRVEVLGQLNVILQNCPKSRVTLKGAPVDVAQVQLAPSHQAIRVSLGAGYPTQGPVTATICTPYINAFSYKGNGVVKAVKLRSAGLALTIDNPGSTKIDGTLYLSSLKVYGSSPVEINGITTQALKIYLYGQPHIKLGGVINLCHLNVAGNASISMYWLKSDYLTVRAKGNAFVQLAGIANVLDAELRGNAKLSASFLRAKRTFIKTYNHAQAQISTLDRQHTKASDASDIYFYKIPEMRTDFMAYNGAVLDMRDMDAYSRRDYDRYNR